MIEIRRDDAFPKKLPLIEKETGIKIELKTVTGMEIRAWHTPIPAKEQIFDGPIKFSLEGNLIEFPSELYQRPGLVTGFVDIYYEGNIIDQVPFEFKVVG